MDQKFEFFFHNYGKVMKLTKHKTNRNFLFQMLKELLKQIQISFVYCMCLINDMWSLILKNKKINQSNGSRLLIYFFVFLLIMKIRHKNIRMIPKAMFLPKSYQMLVNCTFNKSQTSQMGHIFMF